MTNERLSTKPQVNTGTVYTIEWENRALESARAQLDPNVGTVQNGHEVVGGSTHQAGVETHSVLSDGEGTTLGGAGAALEQAAKDSPQYVVVLRPAAGATSVIGVLDGANNVVQHLGEGRLREAAIEAGGKVGAMLPMREVGRVAVVGRAEPVTLYQPLAASLPSAHQRHFSVALDAFYAGDFGAALSGFLVERHRTLSLRRHPDLRTFPRGKNSGKPAGCVFSR